MSHWLLRFFGTMWHALFFGMIMPICLLMVSWSLDQLIYNWWGVRLYHTWWMESAGMLLLLSGLLLAALASWTLYIEGKGFPWSLGAHVAYNPQKLVRSGPYSVVRHPMGTSYLLYLLGLGCLLPSLTMLVWIVPLMGGLLYEYFEFTEEVKLRHWFGQEYEAYHHNTPSLLPWSHLDWAMIGSRPKRWAKDEVGG